MSQRDQIESIIRQQREAHRANPYPSVEERAGRIKRLIGMLASNDQKICDALMADFGNRPEITTRMAEILGTIGSLKYSLDNIENWMQTDTRITPAPAAETGATSEVEYLPLGSVGVISPWNLPINLSFGVMGGIFAAGNRAVLKPSEVTSNTEALIAEMVAATFDPSELAVVTGGADVSAEFASSQFNHIMFTGSTGVGRKVAVAAAQNLVPCTLELGGKNSIVVSKTAQIDDVINRVMMFRMLNGGQICLGPDVLFIHESMQDEFIEAAKKTAHHFFPQMQNDPDYGQVINDRNVERLKLLVSEVEEKNAGEVVYLFDQEQVPLARRFPPIIVKSPSDDTQLMQNEVFGPILSVFPYTNFDDVVTRINTDENIKEPLGLYYFGHDEQEIKTMRFGTQSGGLCINTLAAHYSMEDLPFGGVGRSGMGAYHGVEGFKTFSHARPVYTSTVDTSKPMQPPHSDAVKQHAADMVKSVLGAK